MRGRISDIFPIGPKCDVRISMDVPAGDVEEFFGRELEIDFKQYREKRSLDSNAYFHVLCDKLRKVLGITMAECKNTLISSYGQIEYIGDEQAVIKTNIEPEEMIRNEYLHTSLIKVSLDGAYFYRVYRGSHTYDTAEMSQLIKGTVEECKAQGIDTATPEEIARMNALWGEKHGDKQ